MAKYHNCHRCKSGLHNHNAILDGQRTKL